MTEPEIERFTRMVDLLERIEAGKWTVQEDSRGKFIEAFGEMGEVLTIARLGPDALEDEIAFIGDAVSNLRFAVDLVERAMRHFRPPQKTPAPADYHLLKNFAAEAAMKCQDQSFRKWLEERHGLEPPLTYERATQRVRSLLGVRSRRELNVDPVKAARWKKLRGDYDAWRRTG